jgi:hypothetical protein
MVTATLRLAKKNFDHPDQRKEFGKARFEWVDVEDSTLARITLQPGWMWSKDVRPRAKTHSCPCLHIEYVISGCMEVLMDDGTRMQFRPGDFAVIPPGHDNWVVGDEPFCAVDFGGCHELR